MLGGYVIPFFVMSASYELVPAADDEDAAAKPLPPANVVPQRSKQLKLTLLSILSLILLTLLYKSLWKRPRVPDESSGAEKDVASPAEPTQGGDKGEESIMHDKLSVG